MHMTSSAKVSVILNIISSILAWGGLAVGIAAVASNKWIVYSPTLYLGLWNVCGPGQCYSFTDETSALLASRAFMILMCTFFFCGGFVNIYSQWRLSKKARELSAAMFGLATISAIIGASVFTGTWEDADNLLSYNYGEGAIMAWTSAGAGFMANLFNYLSARKMDSTRIEE